MPCWRFPAGVTADESSAYQSEARFVIVSSPIQFDPTISSILTLIMITSSSSFWRGSGMPNHSDGELFHTQRIFELSCVRTELLHLFILVPPNFDPSPDFRKQSRRRPL